LIITPSKTLGRPNLIAFSTQRELTVVRLLENGRTPAEIAEEMRVTEGTMRQYLRVLALGCQVRGIRQLGLWCARNPGVLEGRPAYAGLRDRSVLDVQKAA